MQALKKTGKVGFTSDSVSLQASALRSAGLMHLALNELEDFINKNLESIHPRNLVVTLNLIPNIKKGIFSFKQIEGGQERVERKLADVCQ